MALASRWLLFLTALWAATEWSLAAATGPENQAFQAAYKELTDGFYRQADADFAAFVLKFPNSPLTADAYLSQAEARVKMGDYAGALEILTAHQAQAGKRADEYLMWQGEALSQKGDYQAAAEMFGKLSRDFPSSPHRLEAAIREAREHARLDDWKKVLELLLDTNRVFQSSVRAHTTNEMVARGFLLLSEAHLRNGEPRAAEQALEWLRPIQLSPELSWQRQFLYCRMLSATERVEAALEASTNLLNLANAAAQPNILAQSFTLQAELFERLGRSAEALAAYQRNLACNVLPERQRHAVLKIAEISERIGKLEEAAKMIEQFINQCPTAECGDLARLTIGELKLRQHQTRQTVPQPASTNALAATNLLQQALASFQTFTNKPNSDLFGKAQLDLGWCYWLSERTNESERAFETAIEKLPPSLDQATAWFKLADVQFQQSHFGSAITSYTAVVERFGSFPEVSNTLFEPALYQLVRAGLAETNLPIVTNALSRILTWFPNGFHTERAMLIAGPAVGEDNPAEARRLFDAVIRNCPGSALLPELELAVARTYEQANDWNHAIAQYERLKDCTNYEAQARAEYSRARACAQAGQLANAFNDFTNFLARFPTNEFAPKAQWWVADYYYGLGNLKAAEENYQIVYQNTNWPISTLSYQARMMAGRAAFDRRGWKDATDYFFKLAKTPECPAEIRARAWCALGDTLISQDSTNKLADYKDALNAFDQVAVCCPSNQLAVVALGKKAECLLQFAEASQDYLDISNAFQQVFASPLADGKARAIAKVGLGLTCEKMAQLKKDREQAQLLEAAQANYMTVFYPKDETFDLFWTREAGLRLAKMAEARKEYAEALNVYLRLRDELSLRLDAKIEDLRAKAQQRK